MFDDDAWDEEQWEAYLRDNDRRVDRITELLFRFLEKYPRPDTDDADAFHAWRTQLRRFLQEKGWHRDDPAFPFFLLEDDAGDDAAIDALFDDDEDVHGDLDRVPIYRHAAQVGTWVLEWADELPSHSKDTTLVHFCTHITQIAANVARGHSYGEDRDNLGARIACAKRGLADANAALDLLRRMKRAPYMDEATYLGLFERVYEVRNELGVYIQDLRDRFNLGID